MWPLQSLNKVPCCRSNLSNKAPHRVSPLVSSILRGRTITPHEITWFPAHMGSTISGITNSNKLAHARAQGLVFRAGLHSPGLLDRSAPSGTRPQDGNAADRGSRDILATFNEVTSHYIVWVVEFTPSASHQMTRSYPQTATNRGLLLFAASVSVYMQAYPDCSHCGGKRT